MKPHGRTPVVSLISSAESAEALTLLRSSSYGGATIPIAAAIGNAIFDATGVRLRETPFTPKRVLAGMQKQT